MNTRYRRAWIHRAQVSLPKRQLLAQRAVGVAVIAVAYAIVIFAARILP